MKVMDIRCIFLMLVSMLSVVEAETLKPSVVALEGDAAKIDCPTIEIYESYFWRKGESIHDSTEVASFVGVPRADSKNYAVTASGTFYIKNVSQKDEGKYFCRGVSDNSSSTTNIMVFVQASLQNFELSIDLCGDESSCCSRNIDLSKPIELICIAKNASPSMTLKWFSGSREIESNITVNKYNLNDAPSSTTIVSTIKDVYRTPITLTCQVDPKSRTDGGKFVNIRLKPLVPITYEEPPAPDQDLVGRGWMITAVILLVFCIMLIMGMFKMYMMHRRNSTTTGRPSVPNKQQLFRMTRC